MKHIKNFKRYSPETEEEKMLERDINAIFLISGDGQDWYECQQSFSEDTIKVMYDAEGVIRAIAKDISSLFPEGRSVIELTSLPVGTEIDGNWLYSNGQIVPRGITQAELTKQAESKKARLLLQAEKMIAPFRDAVELEIATDEEKDRYVAWRNYRVIVNRVDTSDPEKISWPNCPE